MKRLAVLSCAALASATLLTQAANAGVVTKHDQANNLTDRSHWRAEFRAVPAHNINWATLKDQARANVTLPYFQNSITSPLNNQNYTYDIVGTDPTKSLVTTKVKYRPIALRIHFSNGVVLDPTQPACNDTVSVDTRFFTGPLFSNNQLTSNGINMGNTQYEDAFMRAEFWNYVQGSQYHVLLVKPKKLKLKVVNVNAPSGSTTAAGACSGANHDLGEIPYGAYVSLIESTANQYAKPNELPVMIAYNTVQNVRRLLHHRLPRRLRPLRRDAGLRDGFVHRPRRVRCDRGHLRLDA